MLPAPSVSTTSSARRICASAPGQLAELLDEDRLDRAAHAHRACERFTVRAASGVSPAE